MNDEEYKQFIDANPKVLDQAILEMWQKMAKDMSKSVEIRDFAQHFDDFRCLGMDGVQTYGTGYLQFKSTDTGIKVRHVPHDEWLGWMLREKK